MSGGKIKPPRSKKYGNVIPAGDNLAKNSVQRVSSMGAVRSFNYLVLYPIVAFGSLAILLLIIGEESPKWLLCTLLFWVAISGIGVSTCFHKILAHRNFNVSRRLKCLCTFLGCLSGQGSPLYWVAIHRGYHHVRTESNSDIHSPGHGIWHSYFGWYFSEKLQFVRLTSTKDLMRDRFILFLHRNYKEVFWSSALVFLVVDWRIFLFGHMLSAFWTLNVEGIVNCLSHLRILGYRNYNTPDNSINNPIFALVTWGQGFHNNHHAFPEKWCTAHKWWEFDLTALWIPLMKKTVTQR